MYHPPSAALLSSVARARAPFVFFPVLPTPIPSLPPRVPFSPSPLLTSRALALRYPPPPPPAPPTQTENGIDGVPRRARERAWCGGQGGAFAGKRARWVWDGAERGCRRGGWGKDGDKGREEAEAREAITSDGKMTRMAMRMRTRMGRRPGRAVRGAGAARRRRQPRIWGARWRPRVCGLGQRERVAAVVCIWIAGDAAICDSDVDTSAATDTQRHAYQCRQRRHAQRCPPPRPRRSPRGCRLMDIQVRTQIRTPNPHSARPYSSGRAHTSPPARAWGARAGEA
ncbi:hypothetical protein C8J57DRAFT_1471049 [Mycena rebaudengoi]|nr:hypothetical protein C8J57DRAFT_1471049 [Mycena rebaudengoi]